VGLGVGGLGVGVWAPTPKPPTPNPQSPIPNNYKNQLKSSDKFMINFKQFINLF